MHAIRGVFTKLLPISPISSLMATQLPICHGAWPRSLSLINALAAIASHICQRLIDGSCRSPLLSITLAGRLQVPRRSLPVSREATCLSLGMSTCWPNRHPVVGRTVSPTAAASHLHYLSRDFPEFPRSEGFPAHHNRALSRLSKPFHYRRRG